MVHMDRFSSCEVSSSKLLKLLLKMFQKEDLDLKYRTTF